jgi:dolichol-phosphate mannosyltransferase
MNYSIIIIPTYNEKENINQIINAVFSLDFQFHVLIVDDNSPDGTSKIVETLQEKYNPTETKLHLITRPSKLGLGTAYIDGFKFALQKDYKFIFEMDSDFSHNPKDLLLLYNACDKDGADIAIGSRYSKGVNVVNWPLARILLSYIANKYVRLVTNIPVHDSTSGFICCKKEVLEVLPLNDIKFNGYAFQIYIKFLAWKSNFKLTEVSIIFTNRVFGVSKMSFEIFLESFWGVPAMEIKSWFQKRK